MTGFYIRQAARSDLDSYVDYLAAEAGPVTAGRFVLAARASFTLIARNPGVGTAVHSRATESIGIRKWRVKGFEKLLIFYRPAATGVEIVRLLHASQDWWSHLELD